MTHKNFLSQERSTLAVELNHDPFPAVRHEVVQNCNLSRTDYYSAVPSGSMVISTTMGPFATLPSCCAFKDEEAKREKKHDETRC
jgi:hypothetical protein